MAEKYFQSWYQQNASKLNQARKQRYQSDPAYREQVKQRAAEYRARMKPETKPLPGLTVKEVCDLLDITPWTLNKWRQLGYYPEPFRVKAQPVFSPGQLELLKLIRTFFQTYPKRMAASHREELKNITDVVSHNWQE